MESASQWSVGGVWGKTSPNFEGSYGIVQKAQFWNVDNFFSSNLRKMKRGVRKLRKDSLLSNFSSHVVFGQQKILGKICSFSFKCFKYFRKACECVFQSKTNLKHIWVKFIGLEATLLRQFEHCHESQKIYPQICMQICIRLHTPVALIIAHYKCHFPSF